MAVHELETITRSALGYAANWKRYVTGMKAVDNSGAGSGWG
jgi:hypothetical protein